MTLTGNKLLDATIKAIQKKSSKAMFSLGPGYEQADPLPTGSAALDAAIGIGGIPVGKATELFGPESSGKTTLALRILKSWIENKEKLGQSSRMPLFVDAEHATGNDMLRTMGIDPDEVLWLKPSSAEDALNSIHDLVITDQIGLVILDSIDALQTEKQLEKKVGEDTMGGIAKPLSFHMRGMCKIIAENNTTLLYINQIRDSLAMFGSPITVPGGKAMKFYSHLRLETMTRQDSKLENAFLMRVKIIKNKVSPPRKDPILIDCIYGKGPEKYYDLINACKTEGLVRFAGPSARLVDTDTGEETTVSSGGFDGLKAWLQEDEQRFFDLRDALLNKNKAKELPIAEDEEIGEEDVSE